MVDESSHPTDEEFLRAERLAASHDPSAPPPPGAVRADASKLAHVNTYGALPRSYVDRPFVCVDCGVKQIWRAEDQKWFYEEAKGHIDAHAVRCRPCRQQRRPQG